MPTKKPIISIVIEPESLKKIEDYQFKQRISSRSQVLNEIISLGLKELERKDKQ